MAKVAIRAIREKAHVEQQAVDRALALGVRSLKLALRADSGWPDRMFLIPGGRPLFIEFKAPGADRAPLQEQRSEILKKLGYDVECHDNPQRAVSSIVRALAAARRSKDGGQVSP